MAQKSTGMRFVHDPRSLVYLAVCFYILRSVFHSILSIACTSNLCACNEFHSRCSFSKLLCGNACTRCLDRERKRETRLFFDFVIVVACCRCVHTCEHLSFLLAFKFRLIEYYMVNITSNADLSWFLNVNKYKLFLSFPLFIIYKFSCRNAKILIFLLCVRRCQTIQNNQFVICWNHSEWLFHSLLW